jgi:acyl-CoA hydrolase
VVVARLFTIAMNTPIEVDIYGHVNSTRARGSPVMNGLGGSGDFLRNAYLSIVHVPSVHTLRDGRVVSCVMPYLDHVDHTEHDIKCIVTEHGYADLTAVRSPRHRAEDVIEHCAHPHFRPLLREYVDLSGTGDEPHATRLETLERWWRDYDAACASFPR